MDKRNYKKTDQAKQEKKDRGDNLKKVEKVVKRLLDSVEEVKSRNPGGDSERKITKVDKTKSINRKLEDKAKVEVNHRVSKENIAKKSERTEDAKLDKEERKKIRDKYTLKLKNVAVAPSVVKKEDVKLNLKVPVVEAKNDRISRKPIEIKHKIASSIDSIPSEHTKIKRRDSHRKPLIKTVVSKNDSSRVFKAVTFVDQKDKPTILQIKIPSEIKSKRPVDSNSTLRKMNTVSKVSLKDKIPGTRKKPKHRKKDKRLLAASPDLSVKIRSPPTEVAKWAPSSINRHTKPYYEAWVNTTLAAISKNSRKDKLFLEKQNVLQTFQRALAERPETPELVYENFTDEKYTGRIKVKHRR